MKASSTSATINRAPVTAAFFDKSTGKLSKGCVSRPLKGFDADWSYVASLALDQTTGTGGVLYVAEYGAPSSIGGD